MTHKKTRRKLLHISSSLKMGGAERVLVDVIDSLRDHYEQEVLFFYDGPHRSDLERMGIVCHRVSGFVCLYDPIFWVRIACAIRRARPVCIHSMLWGANWSSRLMGTFFGIPVINGLHNSLDGYGSVRRLLDRTTLGLANCYVAVSDMVKNSCKRVYPAVRDEQIAVIENGVRLAGGTTESCSRAELGISDDAYVVGTVGRFEPEKNQELLVRAFAAMVSQVPHVHLMLVGYGSQEAHVRGLVARLGLDERVCFVIGKPAGAYYPLFDCFVLSSPREGLPMALLEALAHAIPCVVANLDAQQPPLVHGQNGLLARSYDADALAESLIALVDDPVGARRMGAAGKQLVAERYTVARMADAYRSLFDQCSAKNKNHDASH